MLPEGILGKLENLEKRYRELQKRIQEVREPKELKRLSKELKDIEELYHLFQDYKKILKSIGETKELLEDRDEEIRKLAKEELKSLYGKLEKLEGRIKEAFVKDEEDKRSIVLEIRAGTGGEEAALFAGDLLRMYQKFCERRGFKFNIVSFNKTSLGGYKEVVVLIEGEGAYSWFKYEKGVHRVQRVPITESGGRIHTSTATVAVIPQVEEGEVEIKEDEIKVETFRASGAGGQYVNTTETAVRITHLPTGIVVSCQDERSQYQNKRKALKILQSKLREYYKRKKEEEITKERKKQIGTGERSEKIRTYNFPQGRITDHRINLTLYKLREVLEEGELEPIVEALRKKELEEKLSKI